MEQCPKLFVYGTLQQAFENEAVACIRQHFTFLSSATVKGSLFDVGDYPAAIPGGNSTIEGEIYVLTDSRRFEQVFKTLDVYEAAVDENVEDLLYRRELTIAEYQNKKTTVYIYWYNKPVAHLSQIVSGNYYQHLQQKSVAG